MNLDDETLLSAYLDDELDEADRLAVEDALGANPRLAERLRDLAMVHDLLASQARPTLDRDLAPAIVGRMARPTRVRLPGESALSGWRWGLPLGLGLGTAAALLIALGLAMRGVPHPAPPRLPNAASPVPLAQHPHTSPVPSPEAEIAHQAPIENAGETGTTRDAARPEVEPPRIAAHTPGPGSEERKADQERQRLLALLDDPDLQRVLITTDALEPAAQEVDEVIRKQPRKDSRYGRITIRPGLTSAPNDPKGAVVFVVVGDERELSDLGRRLRASFAEDVKEAEPVIPVIVSQLAQVDQIDIRPAVPGAPLRPIEPSEMPGHLAIRAPLEDSTPDRSPTPQPAAPASQESRAESKTQRTLLIWVSAREQSRPEMP
jgi:hypothetical protein